MSSEKWERVELNQIAKIFDCPHSTPKWTNSGVFVIRSWNVRGGRLNFDKTSFTDDKTYLERVRRAKLEFGDLVLTREAPMGEVCIIPENLKCCLGQRVVLIKPSREKVDPHFLLYSFQSVFVQSQIMANEGTGSTVSNLRIPLIETLKILLPPLPTQRRIASMLTALDDKSRMNETLEGIAQALWGEWFGKYAEGEELPEGWKEYNLEQLVESVSKTYKFKKDKIIFLNTSDILDGQVLTNSYSNVSDLPGQAKKSIQTNDILYSEIRPANKRYAFVHFDGSEFVVSTKLMVLRSKGIFDPLLIYFYLTRKEILDRLQLLAESRSGTFP